MHNFDFSDDKLIVLIISTKIVGLNIRLKLQADNKIFYMLLKNYNFTWNNEAVVTIQLVFSLI